MKETLYTSLLQVALISVILPLTLSAQPLMLNEIVASNRSSLEDEDGDTPDWIEIFNPAETAVTLSGITLSDDIEDPAKWSFESGEIAGNGFLVIFASDKDRQGNNVNWDLLITEGDDWRYFIGSSAPPGQWKDDSFDETVWDLGPSGFGYGDEDDNTVIPTTMSVYLRRTFTILDTSAITDLLFHMDYDDGYVAYMNGVEFSRANLGIPGSPVSYNTPSDNWTEPSLAGGIELPFIQVPKDVIQNGDNVLAIEVHNHSLQSSDMTAIPFLTQGVVNGSITPPPPFLRLPAQHQYHTNFSVSSGGELIFMTALDGTLDSIRTPVLPADISWGRHPDGADALLYFNPPSPGMPNSDGVSHLPSPPEMAPGPGFYNGGIVVSMGEVPLGRQYRYTLDGSIPDLASMTYANPLPVTETTVIRVMTCDLDGTNPWYGSYSYFINEETHLPVMSVTFEPDAFFDHDTGMYVMGPNAESAFPHFGANFWQDWEREVHLEYFEDSSGLTFAAPAGAKIFGGWSRGQAQRSISLFARSRYGASSFDHSFFNEFDVDSYEALVMRNAGNDWNMSGYRDGFMTGLVADRDIDTQAFQPIEVYFNGEFWGIYNLREKVNEHFIATHHPVNTEDIDLLGLDGSEVIHGTNSQYLELIDYVNTHSLATDGSFEFVRERVNIDNFIDYQLSQIYFDNQDWPGNNIKFWKARVPGGKWRWILYDTDFGFSIWSQNNYTRNTLEFATDPNGPGWPNPPWSTLLLRMFLTNPGFERDFILTACDLLNQTFLPERVYSHLAEHQQWILLSLPAHFARWGHNNFSHWSQEGDIMSNFAQYRPQYLRQHLRNKFNLGGDSQITVNVDPPESGKVRVHSIYPDSYPWQGTYFSNVPLDLRAVALPGYEFSHWQGLVSDSPDLTVSMYIPLTLTAVFEPVSPEDGAVVINEINYHSSSSNDCNDWVELFNGTISPVDVSHWIISDESDDNRLVLPELILESNEYLVISRDSTAFRHVHGPNARLVGNLDFNFSNGGELIRLFNSDGILVDSVRYDDESPWPIEPDGSGSTLELIFPTLDNGLAEHWASSDDLGTPGGQNSRFTNPSSYIEHEQPTTFHLGTAYPNPFNGGVSIPFRVSGTSGATLDIFDVRGRLVWSEKLTSQGDKSSTYVWNGTSKSGTDCGSGMYVVRLSQQHVSASTKIALLR